MNRFFEETHTISQPLYSRVTILPAESRAEFFKVYKGQEIEGNVQTMSDTNIHMPSTLINQRFKCCAINLRFSTPIPSMRMMWHLLKHAAFTFRIVNRDYLNCPIHLMENRCFYFHKVLNFPVMINPYEDFSIILQMNKVYDRSMELTFELEGELMRPS